MSESGVRPDGYYWVQHDFGVRHAFGWRIAEWASSFGLGRWYFPGVIVSFADRDLLKIGERIPDPPMSELP